MPVWLDRSISVRIESPGDVAFDYRSAIKFPNPFSRGESTPFVREIRVAIESTTVRRVIEIREGTGLSYRGFKHLLGETSLERKCRFIFGGGILILVTLSFYWYGQKTESLVLGQNTKVARMIVPQIVANLHVKNVVGENLESFLDGLTESSSHDDQPGYTYRILKPNGLTDQKPKDDFEQEALKRFLKASLAEAGVAGAGAGAGAGAAPNRRGVFADGTSREFWRIPPGRKEFQYIRAVTFDPKCLVVCHATEKQHTMRELGDGKFAFAKPNELAGAIVLNIAMDQTNKEINRNRAILISTALVTAILAMVASYVIVRYVIVKPVKHLQDVSNAIAAGRLSIRSQIQTGDEFEELSHAFNRMLHNLMAMQQELRHVNKDLDRKVDELAQANLALFEMNRIKSDFLATMSHELRTPLNSIIGFSEVLSSADQLSDRQRRYATNIQSSGRMLLTMINDILDLAKIESGKMEIHVEDFSIRDVCEGLTNLVKPMAERKNLNLECDLDDAIPLLRQDPGKIRQILYNLLTNAVKFTPEGGRVTLSARSEGRFVVIEVEDTGIGIAAEDRETIFEKFRQAIQNSKGGDVLTREHQGTGLGLSIVRELARLLGGEVELDSQPGLGSKFTVRLPLQLSCNRQFEVSLLDERVDLAKAKRIDLFGTGPHISPGGPLARGRSID